MEKCRKSKIFLVKSSAGLYCQLEVFHRTNYTLLETVFQGDQFMVTLVVTLVMSLAKLIKERPKLRGKNIFVFSNRFLEHEGYIKIRYALKLNG